MNHLMALTSLIELFKCNNNQSVNTMTSSHHLYVFLSKGKENIIGTFYFCCINEQLSWIFLGILYLYKTENYQYSTTKSLYKAWRKIYKSPVLPHYKSRLCRSYRLCIIHIQSVLQIRSQNSLFLSMTQWFVYNLPLQRWGNRRFAGWYIIC